MRLLTWMCFALLSVACTHQDPKTSEVGEFEDKVMGGPKDDVLPSDAPETIKWVCNNAPASAYRKGRILQEHAPNYVIKVFGFDKVLSRAMFIEEGTIEKVLGEYGLDSHDESKGLSVYKFSSVVDDAKIVLTVNGAVVFAETELISPHKNEKDIKLFCK